MKEKAKIQQTSKLPETAPVTPVPDQYLKLSLEELRAPLAAYQAIELKKSEIIGRIFPPNEREMSRAQVDLRNNLDAALEIGVNKCIEPLVEKIKQGSRDLKRSVELLYTGKVYIGNYSIDDKMAALLMDTFEEHIEKRQYDGWCNTHVRSITYSYDISKLDLKKLLLDHTATTVLEAFILEQEQNLRQENIDKLETIKHFDLDPDQILSFALNYLNLHRHTEFTPRFHESCKESDRVQSLFYFPSILEKLNSLSNGELPIAVKIYYETKPQLHEDNGRHIRVVGQKLFLSVSAQTNF